MPARGVWGSRPIVVALALLVVTGVHAPRAQAAPQLPAGFTLTSTPSGQGESELTDFAYLPDGSVITTGKSGKVAWVSTTGEVRTLAELPVTTVTDLGLVGLAVAPDYETSKAIYLARALPGPANNWPLRLSRHTVTGAGEPTGLADEVTLLETAATSDVHGLTGIVAAGDGTLWVSVGDAADFRLVEPAALRALDVNDPRGKVLHIDGSDGAGVPGNPFYDAADPGAARSKVYATGFRSPLRLTLDPGSGDPVLGDVGWNTFEEVDLVRPGASYGWPCFEANDPTPGYRDLPECAGQANTAPLHFYDRPSGNGSSVTGGVFYTGEAYPAAYRGSYFFGDYTSGRVWTMAIGTDGAVTRPPEDAGFGREMGGPVSFERGPNGDIAYADILDGTIKRISYASPNSALSAPVTATGPAIRTVADQQEIPGGTPAPSNNAPQLALYRPTSDEVYAVGDVVTATATGTDAEDGPLPVQWSTVAMHCRAELCHAHPGPRSSGNDFSMVFSDHGDDTEQRITATVTDSAGLSTSRTFVARPDLRTLTVSTSVPAVTTINGVDRSSAEVTRGARVSVSVPATASDGVSTFDSWSDGGARAREVVVDAQDVVLTARYRTPGG